MINEIILDDVSKVNNQPTVSSLEVSQRFQKKHKNILQEIDKCKNRLPKSFTGLNFQPSTYVDTTGRKLPCYNLTRNGFSFLVMGFTGEAADVWKIKYIEAFDALEAKVIEQQIALAQEAAHAQALDYAKSLPFAQIQHQEGYLKGFKEGSNPKKDRLAKLYQAKKYLARGFRLSEIAKLLDMNYKALVNQLNSVGFRQKQKPRGRPFLKKATITPMEASHD